MKRILLLFTCSMFFISCSGQSDAQDNVTNTISLSDEDKTIAIEILKLYQNVDSQLVAERNEVYQLMLKHTNSDKEPSKDDAEYLINNIAHIDSVVNTSINLVNQDKGDELLSILETELPNFYAHPHNTVENEMALHQLVVELYRRQSENDKEWFKKIIPLSEWTVLHIESLEDKHTAYAIVLTELTLFHATLENYEKTIYNGEKLRAYAVQTGDEAVQIYASLLMAHAYDKTNQQAKKEKCINNVKHFPRFPEIYDQVKKTLNM